LSGATGDNANTFKVTQTFPKDKFFQAKNGRDDDDNLY
jgi:hypothetical protein